MGPAAESVKQGAKGRIKLRFCAGPFGPPGVGAQSRRAWLFALKPANMERAAGDALKADCQCAPREKGLKAWLWRAAGHFLRSGLGAKVFGLRGGRAVTCEPIWPLENRRKRPL
jgi:hypothetical protein